MEFVYVVKRGDLFPLSAPHGFVARGPSGGASDGLARFTDAIRGRGFFLERRHAEQDSTFKQVIPYTLVMHGEEILLLRRLGKGGEARLHGKLSIGVGGHINPVDLDGAADVLDAGCRRELEEEIEIRCPYTLSAVGVINDDSSDVGSVHFGLVNVARCETKDVAIRETDVLEGSFVGVAALREIAQAERGRFETWSALILERLDEALGSFRAAGAERSQTLWHLTRDGVPARRGEQGFVHCSFTAQLAGTIDVHFADARELVLLRLHEERLGARLVIEPSRGGAPFPHVYGELEPQDVAERLTLRRGADGRFDLSALAGR